MSCSGTVKFFNDEKGFGFITNHAGGDDVFVHCTNCVGNPVQEGDEVMFDSEYDQMKGKTRATNVTGGTGAPRGKGMGKGFGGGGGYNQGYGGGW